MKKILIASFTAAVALASNAQDVLNTNISTTPSSDEIVICNTEPWSAPEVDSWSASEPASVIDKWLASEPEPEPAPEVDSWPASEPVPVIDAWPGSEPEPEPAPEDDSWTAD